MDGNKARLEYCKYLIGRLNGRLKKLGYKHNFGEMKNDWQKLIELFELEE